MLRVTPMFCLIPSAKGPAFVLLVCAAVTPGMHAQAAAAPAPAASAPAQATPPADVQTKPDAPDDTADDKQPPPALTLRDLPAGLDPNPPSKEDLAASKLTWKGEYEATKDGQPVLGPDSRPIPVLYNAKGKRVKSKIKPLRSHPITVVAGTLTVDGWTGKARLNYDIPVQSFLYFSAPNIGTAIVSQTAFPGSREQKQALSGNTLTVHVSDHDIQLASNKPLAGKKPESVWVRLDPDFFKDQSWPVMGYGPVTKPPYAWPGAKPTEHKGIVTPPPLPEGMRPVLASHPCSGTSGPSCTPQTKTAAPPKPAATTANAGTPGNAATPANAAAPVPSSKQ